MGENRKTLPSSFIQDKKCLPMAKEGIPFVVGFVVAGLILSFLPCQYCYFLAVVSFLLSFFCAYFFRDPNRASVEDPSFVLSPGDGRVLEVSEEPCPDLDGSANVVKIFLSIFDVHIQRAPISGEITKVEYRKGKFLDARNSRASFENEQNTIVIGNERSKVVVKQIAGLIARRIVCRVHPGQKVGFGQRLGLIQFGSQVDLYVPKDIEICVAKGDRLVGGVSVVAVNKKLVGAG